MGRQKQFSPRADSGGVGYHNQNYGLIKDTKIAERVNFRFRVEFFNLWNWHIFHGSAGDDGRFGNLAFDNDISSPEFGLWNGRVGQPRNIQVGARLEF